VGIGLEKGKMKQINDLFEFGEGELAELEKLCCNLGGTGTTNFRKYKHLCYLFELMYAVAIAPELNVTMNPSCEWQLKYFGDT